MIRLERGRLFGTYRITNTTTGKIKTIRSVENVISLAEAFGKKIPDLDYFSNLDAAVDYLESMLWREIEDPGYFKKGAKHEKV